MAIIKQKFELTEQHLILIRDQPHILGHIAGKTKLTGLHSLWIKHMWDSYKHRALQAHRGSYKTTAMAIGAVRWMLFNPDDRIAVVRKTFTDAAEIVKMVSQIMEKPEIIELFKLAHGFPPKAKVKKYGQLQYNFKQTQTPEGNLTAHGLDGSLTGKHYDRIWTDDIITLKDRTSRAERERTREIMREIYTNIVDPGKPIMASGTPWHKDDGWKDIPCEILKYPLSACNLLSAEEIAIKRKTTTPFLFAVNYDLEFNHDEDSLFKNPNYKPWDFVDGEVYGHLDAAYDGDHWCAFTLMSKKASGRYQMKGFAYPGNVKDWVPELAKIYRQHRCVTIFNETNPDKGWTANLLRNHGCVVEEYWEDKNKHIKISTNLYPVWEDIDWAPDSDDEYMNQVLDYREGQEPDDAPDSGASLIFKAFPENIVNDKEAWAL
jgi:hypothetical protein